MRLSKTLTGLSLGLILLACSSKTEDAPSAGTASPGVTSTDPKAPKNLPSAAQKECKNPPVVKVAWSYYTSWSMLAAAHDFGDFNENEGQLGKFEKDLCVDLVMLRMEYVPSMNAFQSGAVDGVVITNTDALAVAYSRKKQVGDTTIAVFPTSWSNGADKILVENTIKTWADLYGVPIYLAEFSVSHYLGFRGCKLDPMCDFSKLKFVHLDPDKGAPRFAAREKDFRAFVGWSPETFTVLDARNDVDTLFDSSKLGRYEITDLLVIGERSLDRGGILAAKVLAKAMREMIARVSQQGGDAQRDTFFKISQRFSNQPLENIRRALELTIPLPPESELFDDPQFQENMKHVVAFTDTLKLTEGNAVPYTFGDSKNNQGVMLRFDHSVIQ